MCMQKFFRYYATECALHLCRMRKKRLLHSILCSSLEKRLIYQTG